MHIPGTNIIGKHACRTDHSLRMIYPGMQQDWQRDLTALLMPGANYCIPELLYGGVRTEFDLRQYVIHRSLTELGVRL